MYINSIGYNHVHDGDFKIQMPQGSEDYLVLLVKTPAIFTIDGEDVITQKNSFMLYKKGTPHFYRAYGTQFSNDWFDFVLSEEEFEYIKSLDIPFDKVIPLGDINDLSLIIKNMCFEKYSANKYKEDTIQLYMRLFFLKLSEKINAIEDNNTSSLYEKMSVIRANIYIMPYNEWNVEGMAHSLTMSKSYFQHLYKQIFNTTVIEDVIKSRIEHAKYLLATTDISVIKIAEMCGYTCTAHFMRQFKSRTGMTATQYRNQLEI